MLGTRPTIWDGGSTFQLYIEQKTIAQVVPFQILSRVCKCCLYAVSKYDLLDRLVVSVLFQFYSSKNTIMFDDLRRNFVMNPQNGLIIKPFRKAHANRDNDQELVKLTQYLLAIAELDDLSTLNHNHWERFTEDNVKRPRHAWWSSTNFEVPKRCLYQLLRYISLLYRLLRCICAYLYKLLRYICTYIKC